MRTLMTVIGRELMARPRRRWFHWQRAGLLVIVAGVLALRLWGNAPYWSSQTGLHIVRLVGVCLVLIVLLVTPYAVASDLLEERERRTLPILWLTGMSTLTLLAGRFFSNLLFSLSMLLLLLPLVLLGVALGGVGSQQILHLFAIVTSLAYLATAFGLWCGVMVRTERQLFLCLGLGIGGVKMIIPLFLSILGIGHLNARWQEEVLKGMLSSISATSRLFEIGSSWVTEWNVAFNLVAGTLLLLFASRRFPAIISGRAEEAKATPKHRRWTRARPPAVARPIRKDPVYCKSLRHDLMKLRYTWLLILAMLVVVMVLVFLLMSAYMQFSVTDWLFSEDTWFAASYFTLLGCAFFVPLALLIGACRLFSNEKRQRTLEVLMTTELSAWDIVWGKYRALLIATSPWLAPLIAAVILLATLIPDDFGHVFPFILHHSGVTLAAMAGAGLLALRLSAKLAFAVAVVAIIIYNIVVFGIVVKSFWYGELPMALSGVAGWGVACLLIAWQVRTLRGERILGRG